MYATPVINTAQEVVGYNIYNSDHVLVQQRRNPDFMYCSDEVDDDIHHPYPDELFNILDDLCKQIGATEIQRFPLVK